jgi:hypothetical protein
MMECTAEQRSGSFLILPYEKKKFLHGTEPVEPQFRTISIRTAPTGRISLSRNKKFCEELMHIGDQIHRTPTEKPEETKITKHRKFGNKISQSVQRRPMG